tara:strand:+ start:173 stop:379 length:207 start_codon:yes stop_codon:yes gene_type:complete
MDEEGKMKSEFIVIEGPDGRFRVVFRAPDGELINELREKYGSRALAYEAARRMNQTYKVVQSMEGVKA